MESAKLNLLLNKVVEYNQLDACHFKGFLYKDSRGYYIKVLETISGTDIDVNDILYLKEGEEQYITHADKPKLMRISLKSWHYQLMKFVLCSKTPTPKTMQNGCPYFWLLIFSLFACPFVVLWKAIVFLALLVPEFLVWCLEKIVDIWLRSIDDVQAYEYHEHGRYSDVGYKMPLTARIYFENSFTTYINPFNSEFLNYYLNEKYKLTQTISPEEYRRKREELELKWREWREERTKEREKSREDRLNREAEIRLREEEYIHKKAARKAKWDARTQPIEEGFSKIFTSIRKAFTFNFDWKNIIKRTKQVVGGLITIILLIGTYFLVNGLVYGLTVFIDVSIQYWFIYVIGAAIIAFAFIIYGLCIIFLGWGQAIVNKYHSGKRVWYIEPFIYLIYYPLKYIVLGLGYGLFYVLWIPIKFICYNVFWNYFLVPVSKFLWKVLKALGRGIVNSTGIFGEYFDASYTDYCPGIEWVDTEEK